MVVDRVTEIYVVLENRPSMLGELCSVMADNGVNIEAIGVFHDSAKIMVQQSNLNNAVKLLEKLNYTTELRDVFRVDVENKPGALAEVTTRIGEEGVNIEYCYGTLAHKGNMISVIMDVSDIERALKALSR